MVPDFLLAVGFGGAAAGATIIGGALAIRLQRSLNVLLSFGSGVVLGVALLDLFPEALELGEGKITHTVTVATALCGFRPLSRNWPGWSGFHGQATRLAITSQHCELSPAQPLVSNGVQS